MYCRIERWGITDEEARWSRQRWWRIVKIAHTVAAVTSHALTVLSLSSISSPQSVHSQFSYQFSVSVLPQFSSLSFPRARFPLYSGREDTRHRREYPLGGVRSVHRQSPLNRRSAHCRRELLSAASRRTLPVAADAGRHEHYTQGAIKFKQ